MSIRATAFALVQAFALACLAGTASANKLPDHYPQAYQFEGTIQSVNEKTGTVIADDYVLRCDPNVMIHTPKESGGRLGALRNGQRIGVRFLNPSEPKRIVSDIWVMPGY